MKRTLIIDTSSVLWMSLLAGKSTEFGKFVEHEGKQVWVNGWQYGLENAISHITHVARELNFNAGQMVFVVEGQYSKARRQVICPEYKATRSTRPPQAYEEFHTCKTDLCDMFCAAGATIAVQDGVEGDDVIAYLANKFDGEKIILTQDGDMAALMSPTVKLWRNGDLVKTNPFGPFECKYIPVWKALVGDTSDNIKGAKGFGEKAFLDLLVWGGNDSILAAMEDLIRNEKLQELEDDVAEMKSFRKIIDAADMVYKSYQCGLLHPEWVNTDRQKLKHSTGGEHADIDGRIKALARPAEVEMVFIPPPKDDGLDVKRNHAIYDCELIGLQNPVFLVCMRVVESGEEMSFWHHVEGDMDKLRKTLLRKDLTFVSFNGIHFDQPLIWAALSGLTPVKLKQLAQRIITEGKSFGMADEFGYDKTPAYDHIDIYEVAPGVKISLKAFAGRMHYKTMVDMPFEHDEDLDPTQFEILESYCKNDLGVTEALFSKLRAEINLRTEMSVEHGIDLRSKSDAQVAEAVLKKAANITKRPEQPAFVTYRTPDFIMSESDKINEIIQRLESYTFKINPASGQIEAPEFLKEPVVFCNGTYQMGVGGLHSTHDRAFSVESTDEMLISDVDVSSYYPSILILANLIPQLNDDAGVRFIEAYKDIYQKRIAAKRAGDKKIANALKISLNGTFGKLGSPYASFYSPDLLLAVTLTGQLNLLNLIYELDNGVDIKVLSANTDGIMLQYPASKREKVLKRIKANAMQTGFEYEETCYRKVAIANVNNYLAITDPNRAPVIISPDGTIVEGKGKDEIKAKGLYAPAGLMKNPATEICSDAVAAFLKDGMPIEQTIRNCKDITKFVSCRAVKGGGIEYGAMTEVDDWEQIEPGLWAYPGMTKKPVKRKSPPPPRAIGVDGKKFGRIARWIMSTRPSGQICYTGSGNLVPKTQGARLLMTLPEEFPEDLDYDWYISEARSILADVGCPQIC